MGGPESSNIITTLPVSLPFPFTKSDEVEASTSVKANTLPIEDLSPLGDTLGLSGCNDPP